MNLTIKALVAAAILESTATAQATTDNGFTATGSSFVLSLYDSAAKVSATFDLGKNYADFSINPLAGFSPSGVDAAGTSFSWDLTAGDYVTAWTTYGSLANLATTKWTLAAVDQAGTGANTRGYIETYAGVGGNTQTTPMFNASIAFDNYIINNAQADKVIYQNHDLVANGSSVTSSAVSTIAYATIYNTGLDSLNNSGPKTAKLLDSSMGLIQLTAGTNGLAQTTQTIYGNGASFLLSSTGQLTYSTVAAVPEADTWAMMAAGLGLMGFIGRRRMKA